MNKWILLLGLMVISGNVNSEQIIETIAVKGDKKLIKKEVELCEYSKECKEKFNGKMKEHVEKRMRILKKIRLLNEEIRKLEKEAEIESIEIEITGKEMGLCEKKIENKNRKCKMTEVHEWIENK